ncbi:MAG: SUMF1/EgtB/PvdO family nonheme iron enzyme, partial [Planctomycetes bacterium]|nr:SUMF1/EgtB/PvdO family nonheme iron enzyme [Planctomycetota bacterium]
IKPSNIIISKDGQIKVMDFGLAKNPENDLTQTEMIMGTAKYMSPEQATGGHCDIRSDLYSLGAVLYELATGTAPFVGESATAVIYQHVHKSPVSPEKLNPSLPAPLCQVIVRLLAKDPKDRYQTPEEVLRDCKAILEGVTLDEKTVLYHEVGKTPTGETAAVPPAVTPTPTPTSFIEEAPSRAPLIAGIVVAILILGVGGYFVVGGLKRAPADPGPSSGGGGKPSNGGVKTPVERQEWEKQFERHLIDGGSALQQKQWGTAAMQFEKALSLLPEDDRRRKDVTEKLNFARYKEILDEADRKTDLGEKISLYERAAQLAVSDGDRGVATLLLRAARTKKAAAEGKEKIGRDWNGAAQAFRDAAANEDNAAERGKYEKQAAFCAGVAELETLRRAEKWDDLRAKAEEMLKGETYEHTSIVEKHLEDAKAEIRKRDAVVFRGILDDAEKEYMACRWADAGAKLDEAGQERYREFHSDERYVSLRKKVRRALQPPAKMAYVPAGKYVVGANGDKPEFGPETQVDLADFYIELSPVTAAEYKEFLASLDEKDHLATCHPDEAKARKGKHVPRRFESQKPDAPVVDVDWFDAYAYAAWKGKRLPTEFEMEVAAGYDFQARRRRAYPWGDAFPGSGKSAFGLEGLDDDVPEWTSSEFLSYSTKAPIKKDQFVLRGGFKDDKEAQLKVHYRFPEYRDRAGHFGIRCARSIREDE